MAGVFERARRRSPRPDAVEITPIICVESLLFVVGGGIGGVLAGAVPPIVIVALRILVVSGAT